MYEIYSLNKGLLNETTHQYKRSRILFISSSKSNVFTIFFTIIIFTSSINWFLIL